MQAHVPKARQPYSDGDATMTDPCLTERVCITLLKYMMFGCRVAGSESSSNLSSVHICPNDERLISFDY